MADKLLGDNKVVIMTYNNKSYFRKFVDDPQSPSTFGWYYGGESITDSNLISSLNSAYANTITRIITYDLETKVMTISNKNYLRRIVVSTSPSIKWYEDGTLITSTTKINQLNAAYTSLVNSGNSNGSSSDIPPLES